MNTEQISPSVEPAWGGAPMPSTGDVAAPAGPPSDQAPTSGKGSSWKWTPAKIVVAGAVAVALAVGGGVGVSALASSSAASSSQQGGPGGFGGPDGQGGAGRGAMGAGLANALHGDFVISDGNGGYATRRLQSGTVSAVSSSSITVKSADNYSQSYAIATSTTVDNGQGALSDIAVGDTVTVVASLSGSAGTAVTVSTANAQGGLNGGAGPNGAAPN